MPEHDNFKLRAGKLYGAWRHYGADRRALRDIPEGPPILLTGPHRSGTTWAARMLAAPGLWYIHEPFNPNKGLWREDFTYIRPDGSAPDVDRIMRELLRGGHRHTLHHDRVESPWMPLRLLHPGAPRRVMVKDPIACLMSAYLTRTFGFRTLVLLRHPGALAEGINRLGWPALKFVRQLLADDALMEDHLEAQRPVLASCTEEDIGSAAVLACSLLRVLHRFSASEEHLHPVRFEDLCAEPEREFQALYREYGLPWTNETGDRLRALTEGGANQDYHPHSVQRDSRRMAWAWRDRLPAGDLERVREIWASFDIPEYHDQAAWAQAGMDVNG